MKNIIKIIRPFSIKLAIWQLFYCPRYKWRVLYTCISCIRPTRNRDKALDRQPSGIVYVFNTFAKLLHQVVSAISEWAQSPTAMHSKRNPILWNGCIKFWTSHLKCLPVFRKILLIINLISTALEARYRTSNRFEYNIDWSQTKFIGSNAIKYKQLSYMSYNITFML